MGRVRGGRARGPGDRRDDVGHLPGAEHGIDLGNLGQQLVPVPLGKAAIAREGSDVTLISYAEMVTRCLGAATELEKDGVSVEVVEVSPRRVKTVRIAKRRAAATGTHADP